MGKMFSSPKMPPIQPPPAPPPVEKAPTPVDDAVKAARDDSRRRAAAKSGYAGTILTGDVGTASTGKTVLGS